MRQAGTGCGRRAAFYDFPTHPPSIDLAWTHISRLPFKCALTSACWLVNDVRGLRAKAKQVSHPSDSSKDGWPLPPSRIQTGPGNKVKRTALTENPACCEQGTNLVGWPCRLTLRIMQLW